MYVFAKELQALQKICLLQWNSRGYDVAKLFAHKFTYISPVWLQIQRKSESNYLVLGTHDIDKGQNTAITAGVV